MGCRVENRFPGVHRHPLVKSRRMNIRNEFKSKIEQWCQKQKNGAIKDAVESNVRAICSYAGCEVMELNVQPDHVHLMVLIWDLCQCC